MRGLRLVARPLFALAFLFLSCSSDETTIMEIQGEGMRSPLEGREVTTSGIVTAVRMDGRGFWLQHPRGDGNTKTSDAILIWDEFEPEPGDRVRLRGMVAEFAREGDLSLTQIQDLVSVEVVSSGNDLPEPFELPFPPSESVVAAIAFLSPLEGMLVSFDNASVVGPTNEFGEVVVVLDDGRSHVFVRSVGEGQVDYNPERIILDDETRESTEAWPGDAIRSFEGVVDYSFGNYKLQPLELDHLRGERPEPRPRTIGGTAVSSFNVQNLFEDDDEELEAQLDGLTRFITDSLVLPEILAVQEVENEAILQVLGDRINAGAGTAYRATSRGSSDGRGIENAFLYDTDRVSLLEAYLLSGPEVEAAFGQSSPSPGREPLAGRFDVSGSELVIVANHFKSKRGDDPLFGARQPFERPTEVQRKAQARAVHGYVTELIRQDAAALVLVAGDFNDFEFGEPGEGPDHPLAILEGEDFTNLVPTVPEPYTFIFDGNAQVLDHLLVSPALSERVLGVEIVHGNADTPAGRPRASDHDPPVVRFRLP